MASARAGLIACRQPTAMSWMWCRSKSMTSERSQAMQISVVENVMKLNDEVAAMNRRRLKEAGVFVIDVMGAPGRGKTPPLERAIQHLHPATRIRVIVGDLATPRDAD